MSTRQSRLVFALAATFALCPVVAGISPLGAQAGQSQETASMQLGTTVAWIRVTDAGAVDFYAANGYRTPFAHPSELTVDETERLAAMAEHIMSATRGGSDTAAHLALAGGDLMVQPFPQGDSTGLTLHVGAARPDGVRATVFASALPQFVAALHETVKVARDQVSRAAAQAAAAQAAVAQAAAVDTTKAPAPIQVAAAAPAVAAPAKAAPVSAPAAPTPAAPTPAAPPPPAVAATVAAPAPVPIPGSPLKAVATPVTVPGAAPAAAVSSATTPAPAAAPATAPTDTASGTVFKKKHLKSRPLPPAPAPSTPSTPSTAPDSTAKPQRTSLRGTSATALPVVPVSNRGPALTTEAAGGAVAPAPAGTDRIAESTIGNLVRQWEPQLQLCYTDYGLRENHDLAGTVTVHVAIRSTGEVAAVEVPQHHWSSPAGVAAVESCIRTRVKTWLFPPASLGSTHDFRLIFTQ